MYTPTAQPISYENISSMAFVDGYITVINREPLPIKKLMLAHLQELMEDGEHYGCPAVRAYHAAWLQHMEQGRAACGDEDTKLKLRRALVWHRVVPVRSSGLHRRDTCHKCASLAPTHLDGGQFSVILQNRGTRRVAVSTMANAHPNADHPSFLHVCSYCLYTVQCLCYRTEQYCCRKVLPKNGPGGVYH